MRNTVALIACCGLISLTVGCAQLSTVRAQTPCQFCDHHGGAGGHGHGAGMQGMPPGMQGMPPGMGIPGGGMGVSGPGPHYYNGPASSGPSCPPGGNVWQPTHHHTWEYNAPQNLSYPDPNQPPGIVQYPYYTVKGPTDFFFK